MASRGQVGIVGCGLIGASWAMVFARAGWQVRVWQRSDAPVVDRIRGLADHVQGTAAELPAEAWQLISVHRDLAAALEGASYVQESIAEDLQEKQRIFASIEAHIERGTIVGSSTSGLLPSQLCESFDFPERFLVAHALTPPHLLPLTEICGAPQTAPAVIEQVVRILEGIGQSPILLQREIQGFAANRLLGVLLNELFALIGEGVLDPADADKIFTDGFGLRWSVIGPLAAMDLNAPCGVKDYLGRYGSIFARAAESRGARGALTPAVIERVAEAFADSSATAKEARAARRDRAIAGIREARTPR